MIVEVVLAIVIGTVATVEVGRIIRQKMTRALPVPEQVWCSCGSDADPVPVIPGEHLGFTEVVAHLCPDCREVCHPTGHLLNNRISAELRTISSGEAEERWRRDRGKSPAILGEGMTYHRIPWSHHESADDLRHALRQMTDQVERLADVLASNAAVTEEDFESYHEAVYEVEEVKAAIAARAEFEVQVGCTKDHEHEWQEVHSWKGYPIRRFCTATSEDGIYNPQDDDLDGSCAQCGMHDGDGHLHVPSSAQINAPTTHFLY